MKESTANFSICGLAITSEIVNLLEKIAEIDGKIGKVYIGNESLKRTLFSNGFVNMDMQGWVWGSKKLYKLLPQIVRAGEKS